MKPNERLKYNIKMYNSFLNDTCSLQSYSGSFVTVVGRQDSNFALPWY